MYSKKLIFIISLLLYSNAFGVDSTTVFTGSANIEDSWIDGANTGDNHGTSDTLILRGDLLGSNDYSSLIRIYNLDDTIPTNAQIIACTLKVYKTNTASGTIHIKKLCKPWTEAGVTWTDWLTPNDEWGTAGALNDDPTSCVACFNNTDSGGYDKSGDDMSFSAPADSGWMAIPIDTCVANMWIKQTDSTEGVLFYPDDSQIPMVFGSSEHSANNLSWIFVWNIPAESGGSSSADRHSPANRHGNSNVLSRHGG